MCFWFVCLLIYPFMSLWLLLLLQSMFYDMLWNLLGGRCCLPLWAACQILVPRQGFEPMPPAMEVWSCNHWPPGNSLNLFIYLEWCNIWSFLDNLLCVLEKIILCPIVFVSVSSSFSPIFIILNTVVQVLYFLLEFLSSHFTHYWK